MTSIKRILSIDGGGIKGALPAAFLAKIEEHTGKKIVDHFDLIAGTSTGGIIAIGLGLGLSAAEILEFYEKEGPRIFAQDISVTASWPKKLWGHLSKKVRKARHLVLPKYNPDALHTALESAFCGSILGDSKTRLLIPAFNRIKGDVYVFKTSHHPRLEVDWKERAVDVAQATAAAPTYLPGHEIKSGISLLDGGVWANNPVGLAVVEAITILGWAKEDIHVLSLGCSESPINIPESSGLLGLALKSTDLFMQGQTRSADGMASLLLGDPNRLHRWQAVVPDGAFSLDSVGQIAALKGIGATLAREKLHIVREVFLTQPRTAFVPFHK